MPKTTSPKSNDGASAKRDSRLEAGITGGGIGTAIVGFASLIQDSFWKQCIMLAAPSIGIGFGALYSFTTRMYIDPWVDRMATQRALERYKHLIDNPALSPDCQRRLREKLEEEILAITGHTPSS
jgi:hypothetical protein